MRSIPPFFRTLKISIKHLSKFSKFLTPKLTVTASKELFSKGIFSQSPSLNSIILSYLSFLIFLLPTEIIFFEISIPIIFSGLIFTISMAKSAVPVAISRIFLGL